MSPRRTWFPLTGPVDNLRPALAAEPKKKGPVDPLTGPKLALAGRVVTMDDNFTVLADGIVYIDQGKIVAVQKRTQPAPATFAGVAVTDTAGTLLPGLIDLHNHLSYNALPLWAPVPKLFEHRGQWPTHKDYRPMISGPMTIIGEYRDADGQPALLPALVRYVECKLLFGGVTTSQGVRLASNAGIQRFYQGLVRNVEQTDDADLPEAQGRIPDLDAKDATRFLARLKKEDSCFLLHLSEGVTDPNHPDSVARKHFLALEIAPGKWALNDVFTGIHSAGLLPQDFGVLAQHGSSMVWSPLSNLLLYGGTARVDAARAAGVRIGLGSDWSPTGSKNLLGEMKVAWLCSQHSLGGLFGARDIVGMATREAARILKWDHVQGSIAPGMRADLLVVDDATGDPYEAVIKSKETDIQLVMINGVARYGVPALMTVLAPGGETVSVGGESRKLFLKQETADPDVASVSLHNATTTMHDALRDIVKLAKKAEAPKPAIAKMRALDAHAPVVWSLALDEIEDRGEDIRPRLPFAGPRDFTGPASAARGVAAAALPLSKILKPIDLDPVTVADDPNFLDAIEHQPNVPSVIKNNLRALY